MGSWLRAAVAALLIATLTAGTAHAGPEEQIREHTAKAMEHFDMLEYELAKKLLLEAVVVAKRNRLTRSKVLAETYLYLGIVYFAGLEDVESAKLAFIDAIAIDRGIQLADAYRTEEMKALLEETRSEARPAPGTGSAPCTELTGVLHTALEAADPGKEQRLAARVAPGLAPASVVVHYRQDGRSRYLESKMEPVSECGWEGEIPSKAVRGPWLHYYIAAHDSSGRVIAASGSRESPHLVEIEVPEALGGPDTTITEPVIPGPAPRRDRVFLSIAMGSGGGYVSGTTEQKGADVGCCFAPAVFHVFPELGFYLNRRLSVSVAARIGFPLDANRDEHSTAAPSGLLRVRYAVDETGNGLLVSGAVGGGVIRHTVKLDGVPMDEGDVDTSASGPLLAGAGAGYSKALGGPMRFLAELNAIVGIPVVEEFQQVKPNFAVQFDVNVGLIVGF